MREVDTTQKCFICDIRKEQFDQAGIDVFRNHIASQHNMWTYLQFMIFLWEQDQDDDDGLELYVRQMLSERDLSWFPMNTSLTSRSMFGNQKRGEEEIKFQLGIISSKIDMEIKSLRGDMDVLGEAVETVVKAVGAGRPGASHFGKRGRA